MKWKMSLNSKFCLRCNFIKTESVWLKNALINLKRAHKAQYFFVCWKEKESKSITCDCTPTGIDLIEYLFTFGWRWFPFSRQHHIASQTVNRKPNERIRSLIIIIAVFFTLHTPHRHIHKTNVICCRSNINKKASSEEMCHSFNTIRTLRLQQRIAVGVGSWMNTINFLLFDDS